MVKKEYICKKGDKSAIIIEDLTLEIQENATMILGFAGIGLIGPIITNTLIEQIPDIAEIGFLTSEFLPPISIFYDGVLKNPFRIYYTPMHNLIVGACEVPFQIPNAYNDLAKTICNWALSEDVKAKELVIFQGIPKKGIIDDFPVYYAAEEDLEERLKGIEVKKISRGIIIGPEATVINEALTNRLRSLALFTYVYQIPTPEAAAAIMDVLNKLYHLNIKTSKLLEEGKEIKTKMLELAQKAQEYQRQQLPSSEGRDYTQYYQ